MLQEQTTGPSAKRHQAFPVTAAVMSRAPEQNHRPDPEAGSPTSGVGRVLPSRESAQTALLGLRSVGSLWFLGFCGNPPTPAAFSTPCSPEHGSVFLLVRTPVTSEQGPSTPHDLTVTDYIYNDPVSKSGRILRLGGLGLHHQNLGGHNSTLTRVDRCVDIVSLGELRLMLDSPHSPKGRSVY